MPPTEKTVQQQMAEWARSMQTPVRVQQKPVATRVYRTTALTVGHSTSVKLTFDAVAWESVGMRTTDQAKIYLPSDGLYVIHGALDNPEPTCEFVVYKNGVEPPLLRTNGVGSSGFYGEIMATAGDYIELWFRHFAINETFSVSGSTTSEGLGSIGSTTVDTVPSSHSHSLGSSHSHSFSDTTVRSTTTKSIAAGVGESWRTFFSARLV